MELEYFKDKLFDLLNDSEYVGIADIGADECNNRFMIRMAAGSVFEIVCKESDGRIRTDG